MTRVLERGIPLPEPTAVADPELVALVDRMQVGDSVVLKMNERLAVYTIAKKRGFTVTVRTIDKNTTPATIRCWRTK